MLGVFGVRVRLRTRFARCPNMFLLLFMQLVSTTVTSLEDSPISLQLADFPKPKQFKNRVKTLAMYQRAANVD